MKCCDTVCENRGKIPSSKLVSGAVTDVNSSLSGTNLVKKAIFAMVEGDCDEVSDTLTGFMPGIDTFRP